MKAPTPPAAQKPPLDAETALRLAEFARTCKAAARAVALYPAAHPAIASSLDRLAAATARLTHAGPCRMQVQPNGLLIDAAAAARPDPAIGELAEVLHRHLIGAITVNSGADAGSWRTLLLLLARTPEEVRADGGIARLWSTAGGPSLEIEEIDYAEVLREKRGDVASLEDIIAAALAGPQLELDDSAMRALLEIVGDPARLKALIAQLEVATAQQGVDVQTAAFLNLLRGLTDYVARTEPRRLETMFKQVGRAAGRMSADAMLNLLAHRQRPEASASGINVVNGVIDHMGDEAVVEFVAGSVTAEHGASERLAQAFQALVPEYDRQRQLLALAHDEVAATELGEEQSFADLWERTERLLASYSDKHYVTSDYGRELSSARTRAVDVERTSDDPPERIAGWLATVNDSALRGLDHRLLLDLLGIEEEPPRWRDVANTVSSHADDLMRVGYVEQAWALAEGVVETGSRTPELKAHAAAALERLARGALMKHVATHLRSADESAFERFTRVCHAIGTPIIPALAEVLSSERDARSRKRLRDVLLGFGASGRESVQQLMNASNWEVRRTAAFLLREFGGSEGLKELVPLLADTEPLVQREAIQGLMLSGSAEAAEILLTALSTGTGNSRQTLIKELISLRDERAAPLFGFLVRRIDRRAYAPVYIAAIEALGSFGGPDAVDALTLALQQGDWWAPARTRRARSVAAASLRRIGTAEAIDALRAAATTGPRGARTAAREELARLDG